MLAATRYTIARTQLEPLISHASLWGSFTLPGSDGELPAKRPKTTGTDRPGYCPDYRQELNVGFKRDPASSCDASLGNCRHAGPSWSYSRQRVASVDYEGPRANLHERSPRWSPPAFGPVHHIPGPNDDVGL